ncbi:MAG: hypothetical protein BJ554DRAFT_4921 [Olpidium bornovanus]|uniref:Uncharacterized protein n=1 Tax=Olpidium bornovanus TaxID=278681 RepID=A0A8H7ZLW5_9FUNG|nr:MAG: hypothetical protein BJ554DRAFT_4921 [Olpidium bornovanus]
MRHGECGANETETTQKRNQGQRQLQKKKKKKKKKAACQNAEQRLLKSRKLETSVRSKRHQNKTRKRSFTRATRPTTPHSPPRLIMFTVYRTMPVSRTCGPPLTNPAARSRVAVFGVVQRWVTSSATIEQLFHVAKKTLAESDKLLSAALKLMQLQQEKTELKQVLIDEKINQAELKFDKVLSDEKLKQVELKFDKEQAELKFDKALSDEKFKHVQLEHKLERELERERFLR